MMRLSVSCLKTALSIKQPIQRTLLPTQNVVQRFGGLRFLSKLQLSKNLAILSAEKMYVKRDESNVPLVISDKEKPMVVMLAWMLAEPKHLTKYAEIYFEKGYDILTITVTPWQLIWPMKGSQLIAEEVLQFLHKNTICSPLLMHGFSVGGYLWGEVLVKMNQDLPKYKPILDRILAQTWDSAADITELQKGLPSAMFPNNPILRSTLEKYIGYHLKTFYDGATQHYIRSSQMFHTTHVRAPALFLVCKTDPVGSTSSNGKVRESWESMGMKTYWKCWDESKHVSHLLLHRDEYLATLNKFLDSILSPKKQCETLEKAQVKQ